MLAFVWALPAVAVAAGAVAGVIVLVYIANFAVRPIIDWITKPGEGFLGRAIRWVTRPITDRVNEWYREYMNALRRFVFVNQRPLVLLMNQVADVTQRTAGTIGDMSEQIYEALWTLNHETVPRKINAAIVPLRNIVDRHTGRLDALEDLNRRVAVEIGDTLRALPWGVPGGYVTNFATFFGTYVQLWQHYWNTTREQLNTLLQDTVPELRRDLADLAQRVEQGIDARLDALRADLNALESRIENAVMPRIAALELALEALDRDLLEEVGEALLPLAQRVVALEQWRELIVEPALQTLTDGLAQLRTELEQGIETGLELFRERLEALELEVFTEIPSRIAALQTAVDALAAEVFTEVGAGLAQLTQRIVDIETRIGTIILPAIELLEAGLEALRQRIDTVILPRIEALEAVLEPVAFGALVLATLRTLAPNLFCRNTTTVTQRICALDENMLAQLLAGTMIFALALDPRIIARAGQEMTEAMGALWRETALR